MSISALPEWSPLKTSANTSACTPAQYAIGAGVKRGGLSSVSAGTTARIAQMRSLFNSHVKGSVDFACETAHISRHYAKLSIALSI